MSSLRQLLIPALAVVLAGGCGNSPSITELQRESAGTYVLRTIAGRSLPAQAYENEYLRWLIVADTLFVGANGSGTRITHWITEYREPAGRPAERGRSEREFGYRIEGALFEAWIICGPAELCVAPPHRRGILRPEGLRIVEELGRAAWQEYEHVAGLPMIER